jgi:peroxiredoxin
MALTAGDDAPDFQLPSHRDRFATVKLSDFRGRRHVVVAFHPLAFTPICASQMQSYESDRGEFDRRGAVVLGVSTDPQPSKAAWAQTLGTISFDLLSDFHPKGDVARRYGVYNEQAGFAERAVFVVDKQGKIAWSRVYGMDDRPDHHEILSALDRLGA